MLLIIIVNSIFIASCSAPNAEEKDNSTYTTSFQEKEEIRLGHSVFFNFRDDLSPASIDSMIQLTKSLENIPTVLAMELGEAAYTGDPRQLQGIDFVMTLYFEDTASLKAYGIHPDHIRVKEISTPYMAGPPQVFDFWVSNTQ